MEDEKKSDGSTWSHKATTDPPEEHHDATDKEDQIRLRNTLRSNINTSEALLAIMMAPTQMTRSHPVPTKINLHVEHIERMCNLAYEVAEDLIDIKPTCRNHINDTELTDFYTSMIDIGHKALATYKNLCTRETSITRASLALTQAIRSVQHSKDIRKKGATKIAKANHAKITIDYDYLEQEVTTHGNCLTAEDHVITRGMDRREEWREQMGKITEDLYNLISTISSNNIP